MKKIIMILSLFFLFFIGMLKVDATTNPVTLNDIAYSLGNLPYVQQINNQPLHSLGEIKITVLENSAGIEVELIPATESTLSPHVTMNFLVSTTNSNVLTYTTSQDPENQLTEAYLMIQMIIAIGIANGIDYDDIVATLNDNDFLMNATLEEDNIKLTTTQISEDINTLTMDIVYNKKYSIMDSTNIHVTYEELKSSYGDKLYNSIQMTRGYVTLYLEGNAEDDRISIYVNESKGFTKNSYNTIVDTIRYLFNDNAKVNDYFKKIYPQLLDVSTSIYEGLLVEKNPVKDSYEQFIFEDRDIYRLTINTEEFLAKSNDISIEKDDNTNKDNNTNTNTNETTNNNTEENKNPKTGVADYAVVLSILLAASGAGYYIIRKKNVLNQF